MRAQQRRPPWPSWSLAVPPRSDDVVRVQVPFAIRKRGGRKLVVVPAGTAAVPPRPQVDNAMIKAIARAFRWQKMLESGRYATIKEIAKAEKIDPSYVSRVLRLALLAPPTVEAILNGRVDVALTLAEAMAPFPVAWSRQTTSRGSD